MKTENGVEGERTRFLSGGKTAFISTERSVWGRKFCSAGVRTTGTNDVQQRQIRVTLLKVARGKLISKKCVIPPVLSVL